jgi:hypothetical protein
MKVGDKQFNLREYRKGQHLGFILYENSDIYFGEVSNFKRHGKGIFVNFKDEVFYGEFIDDLLDGVGRYYYENGNICMGNWAKGYFHGEVTVYNKDKDCEYNCIYKLGTVVEIIKKENQEFKDTIESCGSLEWFLREGYNQTDLVLKLVDMIKGKLSQGVDSYEAEGDQVGKTDQNECKFDMKRQETKLEKQKTADNQIHKELLSRYEFLKELTNDKPYIADEDSELKFDARNLNAMESQWTHYRGSLLDGRRDGIGELTFLNGHRFKGEFSNGDANGKGVFFYKNGDSLAGIWKRGVNIESF